MAAVATAVAVAAAIAAAVAAAAAPAAAGTLSITAVARACEKRRRGDFLHQKEGGGKSVARSFAP